MKTLFQYLPLFVTVAKHKSLTKAAEELDMPLSTVSRRIIALEKELGTPLFHRSARKIELTDSGSLLFQRCRSIVTDTENAFEDFASHQANPSGDVRISMPADIYFEHLTGVFSAFAHKWPDIRLHIHLNPRWVDLYTEPYDIDLRAGPLPDSDLKVRKLTTLRPKLYAAPSLLQKHPAPQTPEDLATMPCVVLAQHSREPWPLKSGSKKASITPRIAHIVNAPSVALDFVLAGHGVTWLSPTMVKRYVRTGELVHILTDWIPQEVINLSLVITSNNVAKRVRLLVDHLVAHFASLKGLEDTLPDE